MSFDLDVQYMVKQGPNWYNLTRTYKAKRKAVSFTSLDEIDGVETSSQCVHRTHKLAHIVNKLSFLLKLTIIAYSYTYLVTIM